MPLGWKVFISSLLDGLRKSFVDHLITEQGIVSTRVVLHYDLLRFIPRSIDLRHYCLSFLCILCCFVFHVFGF